MANYCGKCGSKLDEATGLCPNCDAAKIKQHYDKTTEDKTPVRKEDKIDKQTKKKALKARKKAVKREKRANWSTGKKVRRFFLKLISTVILLVILAVSVTGTLAYFDIVEMPIISSVLERIGIKQETFTFSEQKINGSYTPNEENIIYESESRTKGYVNNIILLFAYSDVSASRVSEIAENLGGEIVGDISGIYQYQIQVSPMSKEELELLCSEAMEYEEIKFAMIDTVFAVETEELRIPDDPWKDVFQGTWGTDWNEEKPSGYNWWLEATKVPSAWQYRDSFSSINVGIVDNGFDTSHEDLNINVLNDAVNNAEHHGTHVAGIIGATNDNKIGITGVLDKVNLYGVDCYATSKQKKNNVAVSSLLAGIELCISNDCQVVNMSSAVSPTNTEETKANAEATAWNAIIYLICMLDSQDDGNDFIVVQAAGNGDRNNNGVDAELYAGYFASITEDLVKEVFEYFAENNIQLEHDISVQDVLDSYIIVGAVDKKQKKNSWQLSDFSNYGDTITVCAPGVDVFSTTVMGGLNGNYANDSGTSMAAPIVSGITAMVWSVNPDMSAGDVKNIIQQTANSVVLSRRKTDDGTYYMINAAKAVETALNYVPERLEDNQLSQSNIPTDAIEFNSHYYYVYDVDTVTDWNMAQEYCEAQGGYLATITSPEEDAFLYSYITDAGYSSVMFGLTDQEQTDDWHWVTGEELSYQNWRSGEPNHQGGYEHYGMYYEKNPDGTWNDGSGRGGPFLCEWGEYSVATTPPSENYYETDSAFGKYLAAAAKTTETGSWSELLTLEADMSIAYEGGRTKTKVTLTADSDVSNYVEDDLSQIEITSLANMKVMGQTYAWSTEYYDGVAHYEYTEPFQRSESLEIPPDFFDFEASIPEEAILTEEVSGNQIRFIVSGEEMTETGIAAVQQMSGVNNLECEDVEVIATLNDSGSINQIVMNFDASVKYQGYDADVTYKIQYTFN